MKKRSILAISLLISSLLVTPAYAATQSLRWEGSGDTWRVTDVLNGYLKDTWFQDDVTGHWYLLGSDTYMYSGLITDKSTGKTYLLNTNHDGTFGRMLSEDGTYNINGKKIALKFNQTHDGTFGSIVSGLDELKSTGIKDTSLDNIPTERDKRSELEKEILDDFRRGYGTDYDYETIEMMVNDKYMFTTLSEQEKADFLKSLKPANNNTTSVSKPVTENNVVYEQPVNDLTTMTDEELDAAMRRRAEQAGVSVITSDDVNNSIVLEFSGGDSYKDVQ